MHPSKNVETFCVLRHEKGLKRTKLRNTPQNALKTAKNGKIWLFKKVCYLHIRAYVCTGAFCTNILVTLLTFALYCY